MKKSIKLVILLLFIVVASAIMINKNRVINTQNSTVTPSTKEVEKEEVQALPKLLDLGSHSCIPCKMMMPILDTLKEVYSGKLDVEFIDVWVEREMGSKYGIRAIPTQIFYDKNGVEKFRHEGFWSRKEIEDKFAELNIPIEG